MNNLYRDLAPITEVAWAEIELEATRTFKRHIAGRRVVDVSGPSGPVTAAIGTGHLLDVTPPGDGVVAHLRESRPLVRLRVPFTINRVDVDDVERGSQDSDWDPVKDAAKQLAFAEDRAIFEGYAEASIDGIRKCSSNPALALPSDPREIPDVISQALSELRLAGVDGPYCVLLSADSLHPGQRDHRARLSDPRAPQPAGGRRDHLGARNRRCVRGVQPRRGLRPAVGHRRVDRLPVPRCRHRPALSRGDADLPLLHRRGIRGADPVRGQAASTASSAERNKPRPSSDGPVSASVACSGCGIRPTTRPLAELMPAMSRIDPLGLSR